MSIELELELLSSAAVLLFWVACGVGVWRTRERAPRRIRIDREEEI